MRIVTSNNLAPTDMSFWWFYIWRFLLILNRLSQTCNLMERRHRSPPRAGIYSAQRGIMADRPPPVHGTGRPRGVPMCGRLHAGCSLVRAFVAGGRRVSLGSIISSLIEPLREISHAPLASCTEHRPRGSTVCPYGQTGSNRMKDAACQETAHHTHPNSQCGFTWTGYHVHLIIPRFWIKSVFEMLQCAWSLIVWEFRMPNKSPIFSKTSTNQALIMSWWSWMFISDIQTWLRDVLAPGCLHRSLS